MKKLRLDVDGLVVESFETAADVRDRGTVVGRRLDVGDGVIGIPPVGTQKGCDSNVDTWCYENGCTGDEPCTVFTWTTPDFCRTDRGCVETDAA